jgi:pyruvate dehydrogenase E2 component (dihydrolipoamide acetyltransferase)
MKAQVFNIPDLGEAEDVEVIEICVKAGESVDSEDPIIVLESDKAAMEIPTPVAGKVLVVKVSIGDTVNSGMPFLEIEAEEEALNSQPDDFSESEPSIEIDEAVTQDTSRQPNQDFSAQVSQVIQSPNSSIYAGPAVRKLAREFGIDLALVSPSGPKGRVLKEDLHLFVQQRLSGKENQKFQFTQPNIDYSKWGSVEEIKLSKFQKTSLSNLHTSWINIPHVTQHDECDFSLLLELRNQLNKKHKLKISPLAFIAKVTSQVLLEFPLLNSSLSKDLDHVVIKNYVNLGIAVDTREGLIVPNIKNSQDKSIIEISAEIANLADAAKNRKLQIEDLKGTSFSISSLGAIGGKFFTPIINPPEVGILGISKTFVQVIANEKGFESRSFLPLSLSYDHRAINGVYAVQFTSQLGEAMNDIKMIEKVFK